ncbi:uncharacterized protein LOC117580270 [Drosophila guanche]|uniref:PPIase cyclophilin-type domain-containing protein n=1 Tax=Drosophila guanche TaxID=7266 RepID=A0A3B0JNQ1_DROGU|nr:uncharacterized protein LOC117580270 [Drosophila guanche]SPP75209.1 Hypothetical predicted protein [Drosophila guanche]
MAEQPQYSEFPHCVTESTRELVRMAKEAKLAADLEASSKKAALKKAAGQKAHRMPAMMEMYKKMWKTHRERVKRAVSKLDSEPPSFQAARVTGINGLRDEAYVFMNRTKQNIQLLVEISRIMRTHGTVNPFRYEQTYAMSGIPMAVANLERLERENKDLGKRLLDVQSVVDTGLDRKTRHGQKPKKIVEIPLELPLEALAKYKDFNIQLPEADAERKRLLRPRIYFDMYLKDARPLGRIVVQLYTEAAPLVVLQMVRSCLCNQASKFLVKRLFPTLWLEADLQLAPDSLLHQPLEYDAKVIDHGQYNNVLSFSKSHCSGFPERLSFAISFKPLTVVNGTRVGFGRIVKGSKICECIQSYGTKNGKLSRGLLFTSCGLL